MGKKQLHESLVHITELLNSDLSIEASLEQAGQVINKWIPNDQLWFHFIVLGLNYRMAGGRFERFESSRRWGEKDESISAVRWALVNGTFIKRDDIFKEKRFDRDKARIEEGTHSQLVVPFCVGRETIGVMNFVSQTPHLYNDTHVENALLFARLVATEIHQMYLRQEMRGIGEISQAIQSTSDLDHILTLVVNHIQDLGYDRVRLYLFDEKRNVLKGTTQVGSPLEGDFKRVILSVNEDPYTQQTFQSAGACIHKRKSEDFVTHAYIQDDLGVVLAPTWADLPLFVLHEGKKRIVGKISLDNIVSEQPLIQARLDRLMIYAAQAANAIWKAQLYQDVKNEVVRQTKTLQDRVKQREVLLEINQAVQALQRPEDMQQVIETFYKNLVDIGFDFRVLTIHRLIDDQRKIFEAYEVMDEQVYRKNVRVQERIFNIWQRQKVHYRKNLNVDLEDLKPGFIERARADIGIGLASTLSVPLHRGVISMLSTSVEAFDEDDIYLFEQFASILSVGLDRVHDLEYIQKENQKQAALADINHAVLNMENPTELGNVARVFLRVVQQMGINAQTVAIHRIVDVDENLVETFRVLNTGKVIFTGKRKSIASINVWREKMVLSEPNLTFMKDETREYFQEKFEGLTISSLVNVPFSLGVISVHSFNTDAFIESDIESLKQIAEIMSLGVKRLEDLEALEHQYVILQENEAQYRNLIRLMDGVVYALDWKSKRYTYMDESVYGLTGYKPEELDHAFCQSLIEDEVELMRYEEIPPQVQLSSENTATVFRSKYCLNTKEGKKIWVMDCSLEFRNESGDLIHTLGILLNLTDQVTMEEGLRQSQKMEAIGQLAGGVAHDFNNLLTGILGLSSLLLTRLPDSDPHKKDVEEIQKAGNRAADLTKQLLAFSRKQMIEPQILDVNDVMSDMQTMLRRLIREDIELVVSLASINKPIEIDRGQLEQVILNLVVNAKDAMPQGGTLSLRTGQVLLDINQVRFMRGIESGAYAVVEVGDTGIGMDAETKEHIFEPFFTTKEKGQGTGLGLATVYGIVAQNKGHVAVESLPNEGSVFRIYLPQVDKAIEADDTDDSRDLLVGCETILLAEDEEMVRELTERILRDLGYQVLVAQNGHDALHTLQANNYGIDLLLTDVVMPGMGGKELAETLRESHPQLPILYMSGYAEERTGGERFHQQASAFIKKPFMPDELVKEIRNLLDT